MVDVGAFRQNVQDMFQRELTADGTPLQMFPGQLEGPNQGTGEWRGSVCLLRVQEDGRQVAQVQIYLRCRFWAPMTMSGQLSPNVPYDPAPLEAMAVKIQEAVSRNQTGLGAWYQRLTDIEFDNENQGIQATVFAYDSNLALGFTA